MGEILIHQLGRLNLPGILCTYIHIPSGQQWPQCTVPGPAHYSNRSTIANSPVLHPSTRRRRASIQSSSSHRTGMGTRSKQVSQYSDCQQDGSLLSSNEHPRYPSGEVSRPGNGSECDTHGSLGTPQRPEPTAQSKERAGGARWQHSRSAPRQASHCGRQVAQRRRSCGRKSGTHVEDPENTIILTALNAVAATTFSSSRFTDRRRVHRSLATYVGSVMGGSRACRSSRPGAHRPLVQDTLADAVDVLKYIPLDQTAGPGLGVQSSWPGLDTSCPQPPSISPQKLSTTLSTANLDIHDS